MIKVGILRDPDGNVAQLSLEGAHSALIITVAGSEFSELVDGHTFQNCKLLKPVNFTVLSDEHAARLRGVLGELEL